MSASKKRKDESSHAKRSAKMKDPSEAASRAESEVGGVRLPQDEEVIPPAATGSSKRKRRPRKLAANALEGKGSTSAVQQASTKGVTISIEVETLKSKVKEIEAQVQEILHRPTAPQAPSKSARRRAKHQKGQTATQSVSKHDNDDSEQVNYSEARHDLEKLQNELQDAQGELSGLKAKKSSFPSSDDTAMEDEDIEDIPRLEGPGLEVQQRRPLGRSVTLSGSYRIPVPVDVSDDDFTAIRKGIKSAQNIARTFIDSDTARRRTELTQSSGSGSWSEWFGGYSMSIAKAVDSMRISSNIETVPARPDIGARAETVPPRRKPKKLEMRNKNRPKIVDAQRTLSETQVAGLLA